MHDGRPLFPYIKTICHAGANSVGYGFYVVYGGGEGPATARTREGGGYGEVERTKWQLKSVRARPPPTPARDLKPIDYVRTILYNINTRATIP